MSHARAALRELAALTDVLTRKPALPDMSLCRQQAEAQPSLDRVAASPPEGVLDALRQELAFACKVEGGAATLPAKTLGKTPLILWNGEPQPARLPGLLETFLRTARGRPRWLRDLIEAWLRDFAPDRFQLQEAGFAIAGLLTETKHPRLIAWRKAHERLSLFDANEGPRRVAYALCHGPDPVWAVLASIGMDDPLRANGGFFRATVAEVVRNVPKALRGPSAQATWSRAGELLEVQQTRRDRFGREVSVAALRFAELAGETARACLDPWLRTGSATMVPQEEIKAFLLRVLGDPRIEPARWADAGEAATGLMRSWLAKSSLEAFLTLISQTNSNKQWRYRQKFWRACLDKMPSAEVWVVLGSVMEAQAKSIPELSTGFGTHDVPQKHDQALLLMKMGRLVLSEWSHLGVVRAWDSQSSRCPGLYLRRYLTADLQEPSLNFPGGAPTPRGLMHSMTKAGLWQGRVAALLKDKLNLDLSPRDYL
jgi:hypothetical protein